MCGPQMNPQWQAHKTSQTRCEIKIKRAAHVTSGGVSRGEEAVFSCGVSAPWIPGFSRGSSSDIPLETRDSSGRSSHLETRWSLLDPITAIIRHAETCSLSTLLSDSVISGRVDYANKWQWDSWSFNKAEVCLHFFCSDHTSFPNC